MSCYSCGGNPNTFCRDCTYPKDTWIAPVDSLPDTFMGDFDHLFRTPNGNLYALSPDRTRWIQVNGSGGNAVTYTAGEGIAISNGNVITNTQPNKNQTLTLNGRELSLSDGNSVTLPEDRDTVYNDADVKRRLSTLEGKTDNFVSNVALNREGNKITITYTFVNGDTKKVEFEDKDTVALAYDDSALKSRVSALEAKPDRDNQSLTFNGASRELSISNGNSVTIPSDKQTITKQGNKLILSNGGGEVELPQPNNATSYDDTALRDRVTALEGKRDNDNQTLTLNNRTISISGGNSITLPDDRDTVYDDTALKGRVKALEDKPVTKQSLTLSDRTLSLSDGGSVTLPDNNQPMHRFYNGDIPGAGNPADIKTVSKNNFRNPDGIKVGDTLEDFWADSTVISRGIWKVLEINGDNVKVQGIGGYVANLRKNLTLNPNTRVLSIDGGGNNVTLPNDKQTISKNGNKIVLSNGGGEVDIPTATPYNDADIKRRLGVLEAKPDNDKQTLSISGNTLSISNGNSVNIPQPNLSGYVPVAEYNKVKGALEKLLTDLKGSGAWRQTGSTVFEGELYPNRHVATGNINLFGGATDGSSFIRTNNGSTENDLAGGIG